MSTLLSVVSTLVLGVWLCLAPWSAFWWDANVLLQVHPVFRDVMLSPFLRGAVSGLGLVNLLLTVLEVHAHLRRTTGPLSS